MTDSFSHAQNNYTRNNKLSDSPNSTSNDAYMNINARIAQLEKDMQAAQQESARWKQSYFTLMSNFGPSGSVQPCSPQVMAPTPGGSNTSNIPAVSPLSIASSSLSPILPSPTFPSAMLPSTAPNSHASAQTLPPALFIQQRADLLHTILPRAHNDSIVDPKQREADFPLITSWSDAKDLPDNDLPERVAFLQDAMGDPVSSARVKQIRDDLRNIFMQICLAMRSVILNKWSDYDATFKNTIFRHLRIHYPEFTYCDDNWKANKFISNFYTNWHRNLRDKERRVAQKRQRAQDASETERQTKKNRRGSTKIPSGPSTSRQRHGMDENGSTASSSRVPRAKSPPGSEVLPSQAHVIKFINPLGALNSHPDSESALHENNNLSRPMDEDEPEPSSASRREAETSAGSSDTVPRPPVPTSENHDSQTVGDNASTPREAETPETTAARTRTPAPGPASEEDHSTAADKTQPPANKTTINIPQNPTSTAPTANQRSLSFDDAQTLLLLKNATERQPSAAKAPITNSNATNTTRTNGKRKITSNGSGIKRITKYNTAENLFNIDFQKMHNNKGTHDQFNEAWAALTDAQKREYNDRSLERKKIAKKPKGNAKTTSKKVIEDGKENEENGEGSRDGCE